MIWNKLTESKIKKACDEAFKESKAPEMLKIIILLTDRLEENGFGHFSAVSRAKKLITEATEN